MDKEHILARVFRFNPEINSDSRFDDFLLPYAPGVTVLGILRYIYENIDGTLAFRNYHCGALICGACQMVVNGKVVKSCSAVVQPGETIVIEPYNRARVIRDLAVNFE